MALLESIGDPSPIIGLAYIAFNNWWDAGEFGELLRWSQTVIDLADGDPAKGAEFGFGSPLAAALAWRGVARWWLGRSGWRQDFHDAFEMARNSDPTTIAYIFCWACGLEITHGVLRADDSAVRAIEEAVQTADGSSNPPAVSVVKYTLGVALLTQDAETDRHRGLEIMRQVRDMWVREPIPFLVPVADLWTARERARRGAPDAGIPVMRKVTNELHGAGRPFVGVLGSRLLVETLLERGAEGDLAEAQQGIDRLVSMQAVHQSATLQITLLRLRALIARSRGDDVAYRDLLIRYRAMAESFGYEGHIAWAAAMSEGGE